MISNRFSAVSFCTNKFKPLILQVLACFIITGSSSALAYDSSNLRIEKNEPSETNDLTINSLGALEFSSDMQAHIDLIYLQSNTIGNSVALDFGGGYVYGDAFSMFLGVGISLEYNMDFEDFNDKYYAEAGAVLDLTNRISITVRQQLYFNQPVDYEEVIMLGLLFRN